MGSLEDVVVCPRTLCSRGAGGYAAAEYLGREGEKMEAFV